MDCHARSNHHVRSRSDPHCVRSDEARILLDVVHSILNELVHSVSAVIRGDRSLDDKHRSVRTRAKHWLESMLQERK